jgi:ArsR family transcriptional regulator, arsenate/arsenite/antimonite-responsive transcriptional repressor
MDKKIILKQLSAIAQEARLDIYRLLVQVGADGLAAGEIGTRLNIPASTLSFHLKALNHAGLISVRQESRFMYYAADYSAMQSLLAYLTENCCAGQASCCPDLACTPRNTILEPQ